MSWVSLEVHPEWIGVEYVLKARDTKLSKPRDSGRYVTISSSNPYHGTLPGQFRLPGTPVERYEGSSLQQAQESIPSDTVKTARGVGNRLLSDPQKPKSDKR